MPTPPVNNPSLVTPGGSALPFPTTPQAADPSLMSQAQQQYPYLAGKDIGYVYSPDPSNQNMLDFYQPNEAGSPDAPRPQQLPMGQPGIQVYNPNTKPMDILADYVSHYAVNNDPKLQALYQQFSQSVDPQVMQQRYQWHVQNAGETRPYNEWLQQTGMPELFRGYTFNQFPPEAKSLYTPNQIQILDQVRSMLGIKQ
jgi:hypothetical protein